MTDDGTTTGTDGDETTAAVETFVRFMTEPDGRPKGTGGETWRIGETRPVVRERGVVRPERVSTELERAVVGVLVESESRRVRQGPVSVEERQWFQLVHVVAGWMGERVSDVMEEIRGRARREG